MWYTNLFAKLQTIMWIAATLVIPGLITAGPNGLASVTHPATIHSSGSLIGWDSRFGPPGVAGGGSSNGRDFTDVSAIAIDGDEVYIGGRFTTAGGIAANNIVRWNRLTDTWTALGNGTDNNVEAILIDGDHVYVGGQFERAGDMSAHAIALRSKSMQTQMPLGAGFQEESGGDLETSATGSMDEYQRLQSAKTRCTRVAALPRQVMSLSTISRSGMAAAGRRWGRAS